jgi:hypothetical protein
LTKTPLLAGLTVATLALLVWTGSPDEPRGGVVLNRSPPEPPRTGLKWQLEALPKPTPLPVTPETDPDQGADEWTGAGVDPGVWATPAEFSDSD